MPDQNLKQVVIFILVKDGKVLLEKRAPGTTAENELIYPGGGVDEGDQGDLEEALKRELKEELRLIPISTTPLLSKFPILGINKDVILRPYLINEWQGDLPERILDLGNPIEWVALEEALNSEIEAVKELSQLLKDHLKEL